MRHEGQGLDLASGSRVLSLHGTYTYSTLIQVMVLI